jgi:hypothetical protein
MDTARPSVSLANMTEENHYKSTDLELNIKYLRFVGIWPADDGVKFWKHFLFCVVFFIGLASQSFILCSEVTDIVINTKELEEVIDGIFSAVITFQGLFKQLYMSRHIRLFQQLVKCTAAVFYKATEPFKCEKEAIFKSSRLYSNAITVYISSICLTASFLYPFIPLTASFSSTNGFATNISAPRPLPYSIWFPVDKTQTPYHEILYGIMSINAISVALYISSADTFIISLMIHTFNQFDILQLVLRNLKDDSINHVTVTNLKIDNPMFLAVQPDILHPSCEDKQNSGRHREEMGRSRALWGEDVTEQDVNQGLQHSLRDCIKQHQRLLTYVFKSQLKAVSGKE